MHTPGPWKAVRSVTCGHLRAEHNHNQDPSKEWTDDDIALIDAAPDMLAALRKVVALCENIHPENDFDSANLLDATDAATDAIAKATGKL